MRGREKESYRVLNCSVVQAEWYFHWWTCGREREERRGGRREGEEKKYFQATTQQNRQRQTSPAITRVDRETDTFTLRGRTYGREERGRREGGERRNMR